VGGVEEGMLNYIKGNPTKGVCVLEGNSDVEKTGGSNTIWKVRGRSI
jgi:hypothetical protein